MRVGIDILSLVPGNAGGAEVYTRMLARELPRCAPADEYLLYTNVENTGTFEGSELPNVREVSCPIRATRRPVRFLYDYAMMPRNARRDALDVLFAPIYTTPTGRRFASVAAVLDLRHVDMPETFSPLLRRVHGRVVAHAVHHAAQVVTLSEHAKRRIVEVYRIPPDRVTVTYLAPDPVYAQRVPEAEIRRVRQQYGLEGSYVLSVASLLPHKNLDVLLDAAIALRDTAMAEVRLALVGLSDIAMYLSAADSLQARVRDARLTDRVTMTGWVPDADLPALYQGATAFVLPSRYEGFGLPVLEAMASGTPVITTTAASLPEVAGDAALLVDPEDRAGLANALRRVLEDADLRRDLIVRGMEQARRFTWRATAERTREAFQRAARARPRE